MRSLPILAVLLATCGCDDPANVTSTSIREANMATVAIPLDHTVGFRDGYLVRVSRRGNILWNGQNLDDATFRDFLRATAERYAKAPGMPGRLWIEIEPGASSERASFARKQVIASGLCRMHRCVEGEWGVKRPVVN